MSSVTCQICLNDDFVYLNCTCQFSEVGNEKRFACDICGKYCFTIDALQKFDHKIQNNGDSFPKATRAIVSYKFKTQTRKDTFNAFKENYITINNMEKMLFNANERPNIHDQMNNIILFLGEEYSKTGEEMKILPVDIHAIIGSLNRIKAVEQLTELKNRGLVKFAPLNNGGRWEPRFLVLTYEGSQMYRRLRSELAKDGE